MSHAPDLVRAAAEGRSSCCFTVVLLLLHRGPAGPGPHRPPGRCRRCAVLLGA